MAAPYVPGTGNQPSTLPEVIVYPRHVTPGNPVEPPTLVVLVSKRQDAFTVAWNPTLTLLRNALADLYVSSREARRIAEQASLDPRYLDLGGDAITIWHDILRQADKRHKVEALIDVALEEYPDHPLLESARHGVLNPVAGADIQRSIDWRGAVDPNRLERITGAHSTLLPVTFLDIGLQRAKSVVRIVRSDGACGSGFLTQRNLLITNHHVLATPDEAKSARIEFNYQKTIEGLDAPVQAAYLLPETVFATSQSDDWTVVQVQGEVNEQWGAVLLRPATVHKEDWVNIIQHPAGGPKQIALYHNVVVFADERRVQYLTDTLPGSSGSPVFNSAWQVVALHHSGGWLREPGAKQLFYRNEGIHVNVLLEGLRSAGIDG